MAATVLPGRCAHCSVCMTAGVISAVVTAAGPRLAVTDDKSILIQIRCNSSVPDSMGVSFGSQSATEQRKRSPLVLSQQLANQHSCVTKRQRERERALHENAFHLLNGILAISSFLTLQMYFAFTECNFSFRLAFVWLSFGFRLAFTWLPGEFISAARMQCSLN